MFINGDSLRSCEKSQACMVFQHQSNDSIWEKSYQPYPFQTGLQGVSSFSAAVDKSIYSTTTQQSEAVKLWAPSPPDKGTGSRLQNTVGG